MKRFLLLFLCLLLLTACGRSETVAVEDMEQPVKFYYCAQGTETFGIDTGALLWEYRDLGSGNYSTKEVMELYLCGPNDSSLRLPFPEDVEISDASLEDGALTLMLQADWSSCAVVDRTLAAACIVYTMSEFSNIDQVTLIDSEMSHSLWGIPLTKEHFLLLDDAASSDQRAVKLYFLDENKTFLVDETRSRVFDTEDEIPKFVMDQLLQGPETELYSSPIPFGTKLLNIRVSGGLCTVNLSGEFVRNISDSHLEARAAVLSIVNSLTELSQIDRVSIMVEGQRVRDYCGLDLREPLVWDDTAVRSEKTAERAYEGIIYLPCGQKERLAPVPVVIHRTMGRSLAADVLNYLLSVESGNSYVNPIPDGTMIVDLRMADAVCHVTFNSAFALCDTHENQAKAAVRSVVATLCELDVVEQVQITINQGKLENYDLSSAVIPSPEWFLDP